MFKVGERRKPTKVLPGVLKVWVLRAESIGAGAEAVGDRFKNNYCVLKYRAHDDQRTPVVPKEPLPHGTVGLRWDSAESQAAPFEVDLPAYDFTDSVELELWGTEKERHPEEGDDEVDQLLSDSADALVGRLHVPVPWVSNAFGGGYAVSQDEPCSLRMVMEGQAPRTYPYELELRFEYVPQAEHSQRASQRWASLNFEGTYELDVARSDSMAPLLAEQGVPFVLRKLNEHAREQRLEVRMLGGGTRTSFAVSTPFFRDASGPMKIDELFQSVKTYRGAVVEKRLYWDWSCVSKIQRGEPYPSGILMMVTRVDQGARQIIEAWDLSRDRETLTQLAMVGDTRFRREWRRVPHTREDPPKHPKVQTRRGQLVVGVLRAWDVTPEVLDGPLRSFAALKVVPFADSDTRYSSPLRSDAKEEMTQVVEGDRNPVWNQVFTFAVQAEEDTHAVLLVQLWNRENEDEEALIGTVRIPVPWVFNGFGSDLGPAGISSYESTFKLKRGDVLDPTARSKFEGGRVTLRLTYQPDFS